MEFVIFIDSFSAVNTHFFITPQFVFPTSWAHFHVLKRISIFLNSFLFFFCASLTHHLIGICLFLSASYTYSIFFTILISFIQVLKEQKRFLSPGKLTPPLNFVNLYHILKFFTVSTPEIFHVTVRSHTAT